MGISSRHSSASNLIELIKSSCEISKPEISSASSVGTTPIGVSVPLPVPSRRSTIHFSTREFSLKPGQEIFRSEEHTSELQSRFDLVCRLLLEKKKIYIESVEYIAAGEKTSLESLDAVECVSLVA